MPELTNDLITAAITAVDSELAYRNKDPRKNAPSIALYRVCRAALEELWKRRAAPAQPVIPEQAKPELVDFRRSFDAVSRLNNEMYRWTSRMSYNGSYVGEPEGLLKGHIREIEHILDSLRDAFVSTAQPVSEPYKLNGWISVDEKMPEAYEAVLVHQQGGIIFCAEFEDGWFYPDEFPNVKKQGRDITHWMPLPAAPAQESE